MISNVNFNRWHELVQTLPDPMGENHVGQYLRLHRGDMAFRVAYMNHLRSIIGRPGRSPAIPRNKLDVPLVSDFDCMDANPHEHVEAILRARKLWEEEKL